MRFAYADPVYLGCGRLYAHLHPEAHVWDDPETHRALIARLCDEYPDGWALSLHEPSLRVLLPMCPDDVRVSPWCKSFASFKPNVNPAYCWEPVIWRGGRSGKERGGREVPTTRDYVRTVEQPPAEWVEAPITLRKGTPGAKPPAFCRWVIDLLGAQAGDTFDDLFPGSGAFGREWAQVCREIDLFAREPA